MGTTHSCCISPVHPICTRDEAVCGLKKRVHGLLWMRRCDQLGKLPLYLFPAHLTLVKPRVSTVKTALLSREGVKAKAEACCTQSSVVSHINVHQLRYLNEWKHQLLIWKHANFCISNAQRLKFCVCQCKAKNYESLCLKAVFFRRFVCSCTSLGKVFLRRIR